jgi:hypothetical protein
VPDARFLRVVTFQPGPSESAVDPILRDVVQRLVTGPGVVDAWVGRQGDRHDQTRVLASTWSREPGPAPADLDALADAGVLDDSDPAPSVEQLTLAVHARFERAEPARILRVFRGRVRAGELETYVDEARNGMLADAIVNDGLVAFALGGDPPDSFVTVSLWTGWSAIEQATGGNTRKPIATRNSIRLTGFEVTHLEVLPDAEDHRPETLVGRSAGGS